MLHLVGLDLGLAEGEGKIVGEVEAVACLLALIALHLIE